MVEQFGAETFVRIYRVAMVGTELPPILTLLPGTTLSIFCKISSETSFSELISGTTSSCNATFLNSILDWTAATFVVVTAVLVRVLTGTGISCPLAIIAFLLLLVKTVGR